MNNALLIYHDLIQVIATAMDACDPYTTKHSERVSDIVQQICQMMCLAENETAVIHIATHLDGIGKIAIPNFVLSKASPFTNSE